jgi:hypothetical protein
VFATGGDDRDPKFFLTRRHELHVHWGTDVPMYAIGVSTLSRLFAATNIVSHIVQVRGDGPTWTLPVQFGRLNYWLWSLMELALGAVDTPEDYYWYEAAYHLGASGDTTMATLFVSSHRIQQYKAAGKPIWRWCSHLYGQYGDKVPEPVLWERDGQICCILRRDNDPALLGIGRSAQDWQWEPLNLELYSEDGTQPQRAPEMAVPVEAPRRSRPGLPPENHQRDGMA